jgi:hypothetical protein
MSARATPSTAVSGFSRRAYLGILVACLVATTYPGLSAYGAAADGPSPPFKVIVHPDNPARSVQRGALAKLFLKETSRWDDGEPARPVDLPTASAVRAAFSENVIKRSVAAVRNYWQQRIFSGRGVPPPQAAGDADVVDYVLGNRGAVGYVSGLADVGRARVLRVVD